MNLPEIPDSSLVKATPFGRPTKYKEEYCQMLIDHMSKGYSYETFGAVIDVSRASLYEWEDNYPHFSDAKKRAFDKCQTFWEKLGVEHVLNHSEKDADGSTRSTTLNTAAWIFNMKNRFKWVDKLEVKEEDSQFDERKQISKLSTKELLMLIKTHYPEIEG